MPQGSLFTESELSQLRITLKYDQVKRWTTANLIGEERKGGILASAGIVAVSLEQAELIPIMVAEAAYGFLYRGAFEAVVQPAQGFRARRRSLSDPS